MLSLERFLSRNALPRDRLRHAEQLWLQKQVGWSSCVVIRKSPQHEEGPARGRSPCRECVSTRRSGGRRTSRAGSCRRRRRGPRRGRDLRAAQREKVRAVDDVRAHRAKARPTVLFKRGQQRLRPPAREVTRALARPRPSTAGRRDESAREVRVDRCRRRGLGFLFLHMVAHRLAVLARSLLELLESGAELLARDPVRGELVDVLVFEASAVRGLIFCSRTILAARSYSFASASSASSLVLRSTLAPPPISAPLALSAASLLASSLPLLAPG